jgi:hypothetical protein
MESSAAIAKTTTAAATKRKQRRPDRAAVARRRHDKEQQWLAGFDVPVPVTKEGVAFTLDQLRQWNDAVFRHKILSNLAIHNASKERCAKGECVCLKPKAGTKRAKEEGPRRHIHQKTTAPKFQARIEALDIAASHQDQRPIIEALVYRDDPKLKVRFCDTVSTDAADLARCCVTGRDRHLLYATNRFLYQQLLFDIDVDLPLLTIAEDVAVSPTFVREEFCPAVADILAAWVNKVGLRVGFDGVVTTHPFTADDFLIVVTDGQPKVSLHVHCATVGTQSTWFKDLFVPSLLRPIIAQVAPKFLTWLRDPESDVVLAKIFDKAPLNGSMFRFFGQTKSAKAKAGRGTALRRDAATGKWTVHIPSEEAAGGTMATNIDDVSVVLLPTEVCRLHAAASAPGRVVEFSPADVTRDEAQHARRRTANSSTSRSIGRQRMRRKHMPRGAFSRRPGVPF